MDAMPPGHMEPREGYPHPGWFLAKSAESLEKKRLEFLAESKRVRKSMKRKNLSKMARGEIRNLAGGGTHTPH